MMTDKLGPVCVTSSGALNTVNEPLGVLPRSGRLLLRGIPAVDVHGARQLPTYLPPNETLASDPVHMRFLLLWVGAGSDAFFDEVREIGQHVCMHDVDRMDPWR
jgi:hypothetical protein